MTTNLFRSIAWALRETVSDTYALLSASEVMESFVEADRYNRESEIRATVRAEVNDLEAEVHNLRSQVRYPEYSHNLLVAAALGSPEVMAHVQDGKRINAIKALRDVSRFTVAGQPVCAGLRAAKEAIEDARVMPLGS